MNKLLGMNLTWCRECEGNGTLYDPSFCFSNNEEYMKKQRQESLERGFPRSCESCKGVGRVKCVAMTDEEIKEYNEWKKQPPDIIALSLQCK